MGKIPITKLQACTIHFMIDHLVGDVSKNSVDVQAALLSAALDGLVMGIFPSVCVVCALLYRSLQYYVFGLILAHWLLTTIFGGMYFGTCPFEYRRPVLYSMMIVMVSILFASSIYTASVLLFFFVQVVGNPEDVIPIAVSFGSVAIYPFILWPQLKSIRQTLKDVRSRKGENKGQIGKAIDKLQLSTRALILGIVAAMLTLIMFACLMVCAMVVYRGLRGGSLSDISNWVPAFTVPFAALKSGRDTLNQRKASVQNGVNEVNAAGRIKDFGKLL